MLKYISVMVAVAAATFNMTKCPAYWEMATENSIKNFDIAGHVGVWHE